MGICISMTVKNCSTPIQVTVAQICSIGSGARNYLPLLVDEGYLLVDLNGSEATVQEKEDYKKHYSSDSIEDM